MCQRIVIGNVMVAVVTTKQEEAPSFLGVGLFTLSFASFRVVAAHFVVIGCFLGLISIHCRIRARSKSASRTRSNLVPFTEDKIHWELLFAGVCVTTQALDREP